jgi:MFS family permease
LARLTAPAEVQLGLRANWRQFTLLVAVNAFVGAMVGAERVVLPLMAAQDFQLASRLAILSFIASFGLVKALANLAAGRLGDRIGRRAVLRAGWLFGLPVPWILYSAPSWQWVLFANVLLGLNQGLAWSSTVIMKIDLAGPKQRGLAMGLNEAAGYLAVSAAALVAGILSSTFGYREALLYVGGTASVMGFALTMLVDESQSHARLEAGRSPRLAKPFREVFLLTSWRDRNLLTVSQVGLVNNLNDGMSWGLFPLYFAAAGLSLAKVSLLAAIYPAVWGLAQLFTGTLSDRIGRRPPIVFGMLLQGLALLSIPFTGTFVSWLLAATALGLGTALVYPTLLAAIGDVAHPDWRSSAIGVYRLWRDMGYVCGALLAGLVADALSIRWAIAAVGVLTLCSGLLAGGMLSETLPARSKAAG